MRKGEIARNMQFPFSHNVFYRYISLVRQIALLCGNGLALPQTTILDSLNLKEFIDDNFELNENGGKLP